MRLFAALTLAVLIIGACGTSKTESTSAGTPIRDAVLGGATTPAVERVVPTTVRATTHYFTSEQIAQVLTDNGPVKPFPPDEVTPLDLDVADLTCDLIADGGRIEDVRLGFAGWFTDKMTDAGLSPDDIAAWNAAGIIDGIVALGCPT